MPSIDLSGIVAVNTMPYQLRGARAKAMAECENAEATSQLSRFQSQAISHQLEMAKISNKADMREAYISFLVTVGFDRSYLLSLSTKELQDGYETWSD